MDSDGMLDWSASECKDYKDRIMATVACACPDSSVKPSDTWEWRGPCLLVRVHGRRVAGKESQSSLNALPMLSPRISPS